MQKGRYGDSFELPLADASPSFANEVGWSGGGGGVRRAESVEVSLFGRLPPATASMFPSYSVRGFDLGVALKASDYGTIDA